MDDKPRVDPKTQGDLASLQRRVRMLQNDRRAYMLQTEKELRKQSIIMARLREENETLREQYEGELRQAQSGLSQAANRKFQELDELRNQLEGELADSQAAVAKLGKVHTGALKSFQEVRLEAEAATLEAQLQEMRAVYQLNTEKLEYNYRLLAERDVECNGIMQHQKRKISRYQNHLSTLISKYNAQNSSLRAKNEALSDQYRRTAALFQDLQKKFKHFERADTARYRDLWDLHENRIAAELRRVIAADKFIAEEILHISWMPPQVPEFEPRAVPTEEEEAEADKQTRADPLENCKAGPERAVRLLGDLVREGSFLSEPQLLEALDGDETLPEKEAEGEAAEKPAAAKEGEEKGPIQTKALLYSLGILSPADLDRLLAAVSVDGMCDELVPRQDLLPALRKFAQEQRTLGGDGEMPGAGGQTQSASAWGRTERQSRAFWDRLARVVPEERVLAWKSLEVLLLSYHETLRRRSELVDGNEAIASENEELRALLTQYAQAAQVDVAAEPVEEERQFAAQTRQYDRRLA
ncbi:hypothetical protein KIPB_000674 [Kipferlia bialata]|uniref:Dynein regulatory complex protein 1 C-terminal domain-containing protein n=1 Tax=Kipferlia bialata TaxID=797122 RepID=A0A9K3CMV8_9EUKA|nr:hypothetical protein KIPB_000674 [Kipferlia bialata]|eukprot:g674.t1